MTQALTIYTAAQVPALATDAEEALEAIRENLGSIALTERDLERIKMPSGNTPAFMVRGEGGKPAMATEIDCVLVGITSRRVYWGAPFGSGQQKPPECSSSDGIVGLGRYGRGGEGRHNGDCATCPMNAWPPEGSADRSKPCSEVRMLFFYPLGQQRALPMCLTVTPGSLQALKDYLLQDLGNKGKVYYRVVTRIGLTPAKNAAGIAYSQANFSHIGDLDEPTRRIAKGYKESMARLFAGIQPRHEDMASGGGPIIQGQVVSAPQESLADLDDLDADDLDEGRNIGEGADWKPDQGGVAYNPRHEETLPLTQETDGKPW